MPVKPRATMRVPHKKYSVVMNYIDPPFPILIMSTNSPVRARFLFEYLRDVELDAYEKTGAVGGEWDLTLYMHTDQSTVKSYKTEDDQGKPYIYSASFPGSKALEEFNYMELIR